MHATLTYRQALWDYLHSPISEAPTFVVEVASTLVCAERDSWDVILQNGKLADAGILEQLVSAQSLRELPRSAWPSKIEEAAKRIREEAPTDETALLRMSRVLTILQRMRVFGAYYWLGNQTSSIPSQKVSVPEAPSTTCPLNLREPEGQYWICVDLFGVRFLCADASGGKIFQRGFSFNQEALERVLRWGAKQNCLQIVVQTVNPLMPSQGRIAMTINVVCPAAVDVAYTIHKIWQHRQECR